MKRFHVNNGAQRIDVHSMLFAAEPTRTEGGYAKWMIEDPGVNFATSARCITPSVDRMGMQTGNPAQLLAMRERADAADLALADEGETTCCFAGSEKHWITDPQGIAREHFPTLSGIPVFRETPHDTAPAPACCWPATASASATTEPSAEPVAGCDPAKRGRPVAIPVKSRAACC